MLTLIKNEITKLLSRPKTWVIFIGFLLLLGCFTFSAYKEEKNSIINEKPQSRLAQVEENLRISKENCENEKKQYPKEVKSIEVRYNEEIKNLNEEISALKEEIRTNKKVDWKEKQARKIESLEKQYEISKKERDKNLEQIRSEVELNKYYLKNNIKPTPSYMLNGFNFFKHVIEVLGITFLTFGIIIFSSDMVSGEYTPPTMKFLLIQPISRGKVLLSKFIALVTTAVTMILSGELLFFLGIGLTKGFGNPNEPILYGIKYMFDKTINSQGGHDIIPISNSTSIMPIWKIVILLALLQVLYIIICCSFAFVLSTIVKSSMVSMAISIISIIVIQFLGFGVSFFNKFMPYCFLPYSNLGGIIDGNLVSQLGDPSIGVGKAVTVLVIWGVICYAIAHITFKKKDILI
ncbi:hypothetical protein C3495_11325 [Clostridiaceae bacterium 14S0207]|nr:hypothetical protein C3495_11325 [Clostridiaceae bacterium 14S0207]